MIPTTSSISSADPGYYLDPLSGAWCTLPWPGDRSLPYSHPDRTSLLLPSLAPACFKWARENLVHYLTGEPWEFTAGQRRFLMLWYSVDVESGRWVYRRFVKRGSKGVGKDPLLAAWLHLEFLGPTQIADIDGLRVIGKPHAMPLVQIGANSESQAFDTLRIANAMLPQETRQFYRIDVGATRTQLDGGGRFECLTSSESSAEGDPTTAGGVNEALALDTPVPTPTGWTTMGALQVGDEVFGSDGLPARVTKATEVFQSRDCYQVNFADGDSIVADAGHLWMAKPSNGRYMKVRTTESLAGKGSYRVPVTDAVEMADAVLPVDPYVLGAWLGDGSCSAVALTTSLADMDWWMAEFPRLGYPVYHCRSTATGEEISLATGKHHRKKTVRWELVKLGIYQTKAIPAQYLWASKSQRLALLQGLVDTDGCVDKTGRVIFVNANENLASGVAHLARSLGHKVFVSVREDTRKASYQPMWRIEWMGNRDLPSARMPRKVARLQAMSSYADKMTVRSVVRVASVPVRCISVDSPDHLFLAGQWKVTHNSHHMKSSNGGHKLFSVVRRNVGKSPRALQARLGEFTNGHEEGADSVAERSFKAWQKQVSGQTVGKRDILYDSIEAQPGTDIYDRKSRRAGLAAAYSDAPWSDLERLEDEVLDPDLSVSEALRFYFNLIAANEESWVEPRKWDAMAAPGVAVVDREPVVMFLDCSKSSDSTALVGCRISDGHVFLIDVWKRPPGKRGELWTVPRYPREARDGEVSVDQRVRDTMTRLNVYWFGGDPSPATEDSSEASYWLPLFDDWHRDFGKRLKLWATPGSRVGRGTGGTSGHAVKFDLRLSQPGGAERNRQFVEAAMQTAADIDATTPDHRVFTHDGDPTLTLHVHHARNYPTNHGGMSLGKANRNSSLLVDAAVTMVGARLGRQIVLNSGKFRAGDRSQQAKVVVFR